MSELCLKLIRFILVGFGLFFSSSIIPLWGQVMPVSSHLKALPIILTNSQMIDNQLFKETTLTSSNMLSILTISKPEQAKAFFCRMEDRSERTSRVPLRIRIGNLDYVNYLEEKNPYYIEYIDQH